MKMAKGADLSTLRDDELVSMTRGGDREAYRTLVERYQGRLLAMAIDILQTREVA